jgi:hypothetical protein
MDEKTFFPLTRRPFGKVRVIDSPLSASVTSSGVPYSSISFLIKTFIPEVILGK